MRLFAFALVALSACQYQGFGGGSHSPADVCSAAMPGTQCDLLVSAGTPAVVSHCRTFEDGSLVCSSGDRTAPIDR